MTDVAGRTAFITGGANGIGLGIARALAGAGAKLALVDIDAAALERARAELADSTEVVAETLDVRDRAAYAAVADRVEQALGPVSLLINNAGVAGGAPALRLTYELWDWGLDINLGGVVNGIQTFLKRIAERGQGGHIVNTASGAGLIASQSGALYHTAKYAVVGLSESLGLELAPLGIGVSVLCPGPVATDIIARTRSLQPNVTNDMTADERNAARSQSGRMTDWLKAGTPPDAVGQMVLRAIRNDERYILTDRWLAPKIEARTKAILSALPAA